MADPAPPAGKKGGKLPTWAYIVAAGIGVLIVFLFLGRSKSSSSTSADTTPGQPTGTDPSNTDAIYNLTSWLQSALAGHALATDAGSTTTTDSGQAGCRQVGESCTPIVGGPDTGCCDTVANHCGTKRSSAGIIGYVCKPRESDHYVNHPAKVPA